VKDYQKVKDYHKVKDYQKVKDSTSGLACNNDHKYVATSVDRGHFTQTYILNYKLLSFLSR